MIDPKPISTNGVNIYPFQSRKDIIGFIEKQGGILVAVNAEKILHANDQTRDIINRNIGYADGIGAVLAIRKHGGHAIKIPGCELWLDIIKEFEKHKTFYLVGGKEDVISTVVGKLKMEYPEIKLLGFRNGYLKKKDEEELLANISLKKPDVVFVAMGSPKQELLMQKLQKIHPNAIYQGLGGSFDVYTGRVKRAPDKWVKLGLEWAYRWFKQPMTRTKRNLLLTKFLFKLYTNQY